MDWRNLSLKQKSALSCSIPTLKEIYEIVKGVPPLEHLLYEVALSFISRGFPIRGFYTKEISLLDLKNIKQEYNIRRRIVIGDSPTESFAYLYNGNKDIVTVTSSTDDLIDESKHYVFFVGINNKECLILFRLKLNQDAILEKNSSFLQEIFKKYEYLFQ